VGDKFVYEAMTKGGFCLGGEESGHIIFSKFASTGDGLITALKIMETFIESKCPSSKLSDGFTLYPQLTVNVRVKDKNAALSNPNVQKAKEKIENELSGNGRILVRKSGTEPLLRVMVEAETKEKCEKFSNYVADVIRENESE